MTDVDMRNETKIKILINKLIIKLHVIDILFLFILIIDDVISNKI